MATHRSTWNPTPIQRGTLDDTLADTRIVEVEAQSARCLTRYKMQRPTHLMTHWAMCGRRHKSTSWLLGHTLMDVEAKALVARWLTHWLIRNLTR